MNLNDVLMRQSFFVNLALKNGVVPSYETVANFLEIDPNKIYEYVYAGQSIMSLDNDENRPLYETISNKDDVSLDERIELENSMCTLTEDEKNIIMSRYYEDLTQSETARKLGITQVMVSRYEKRSLSKMRDFMYM